MHMHQAQGSPRSGRYHCQGRGQNQGKDLASHGDPSWVQGWWSPGLVQAEPSLNKMTFCSHHPLA